MRLVLPVSARDHILGDDDAPVTLVEYADFECPYCGRAQRELQEVTQELGDSLRYVFRHFPLSTMHPHAAAAAQAAEAAGAQGAFWPMHALLFENQDALEEEDLLGYAGELGLDVDRFGRELAEGAHAPRVREDFMSGVRSGVNGTPSFFMDEQRYEGSWDAPSLIEALESMIRGRRGRRAA